ncbi:MAG: NIL domain-containing protein [Verrucomicrobiae bacterium]|nr:NIL domain-containing protein [Verrucomicrobiae bacterium]
MTRRVAKSQTTGRETKRLWLTYPKKLIQRPVIYELGHRFDVVTNIRQASSTEEVGILSLEVTGTSDEIQKAIRWLQRLGIKVEPVAVQLKES